MSAAEVAERPGGVEVSQNERVAGIPGGEPLRPFERALAGLVVEQVGEGEEEGYEESASKPQTESNPKQAVIPYGVPVRNHLNAVPPPCLIVGRR
jgi:hypothetical protein